MKQDVYTECYGVNSSHVGMEVVQNSKTQITRLSFEKFFLLQSWQRSHISKIVPQSLMCPQDTNVKFPQGVWLFKVSLLFLSAPTVFGSGGKSIQILQ